MEFAMLYHMAGILFLTLRREMIDNIVCGIYVACKTASGDDEIKQKLYKQHETKMREEGKRGVCGERQRKGKSPTKKKR